MAIKITLDKAPPPMGTLRHLALTAALCAFAGILILLLFVALPWAILGRLVPPLSAEAFAAAHDLAPGTLTRLAWQAGLVLGALLTIWEVRRHHRWRASHNRRSMPAMIARLRIHRRAGAWLIHRQKLGLLNIAAFLALILLPRILPHPLPWARVEGPALYLLIVMMLLGPALLLLNGARLLTSDVPLSRYLGSGAGRWLLRWAPFGLIMTGAVFLFAWLLVGGPGGASQRLAGPLGAGAMIVGAVVAFWLGRRLEARFDASLFAASLPGAGEALKGDRRHPILYLRSFQDDRAAVRVIPDQARWTRIEDLVADAARPFGPVIAIGRPDGPPETGAARAYFTGEDWRGAVERWADEAQFVLLVAGYTSGVSWELEKVLAQGHAAKLIVLFPPGDPRFAERWAWLAERARRFGVAFLPERPVPDTMLICLDRFGEALVMTSRSPTANRYRCALAIALFERFTL